MTLTQESNAGHSGTFSPVGRDDGLRSVNLELPDDQRR